VYWIRVQRRQRHPTTLVVTYNGLNGVIPHFIVRFPDVHDIRVNPRLSRTPRFTNDGIKFRTSIPIYPNPKRRLTGCIPSSIGSMSRLRVVDFNGHQLQGSIPISVQKLPNIGYFEVHDNGLSGVFPSWILLLPSLSYVNISNNHMVGWVTPLSLRRHHHRYSIRYAYNLFQGQVFVRYTTIQTPSRLITSSIPYHPLGIFKSRNAGLDPLSIGEYDFYKLEPGSTRHSCSHRQVRSIQRRGYTIALLPNRYYYVHDVNKRDKRNIVATYMHHHGRHRRYSFRGNLIYSIDFYVDDAPTWSIGFILWLLERARLV